MTEAGIADGDLGVVCEQPTAENREIVEAALLSGGELEAKVKPSGARAATHGPMS